MDITLIGASDMFARDFATWAVAGEQNVTVVGPGIAKQEAFMRDIGAAKAAGRRAPPHWPSYVHHSDFKFQDVNQGPHDLTIRQSLHKPGIFFK